MALAVPLNWTPLAMSQVLAASRVLASASFELVLPVSGVVGDQEPAETFQALVTSTSVDSVNGTTATA